MELRRLSGLYHSPSLRLVECTQLKEGRCVCVCVCVYVCDVGVVYYVPVHLFVHGASKQPGKGKLKTTNQQEKDVMCVPINGFEPTPSCL